MKKTIYTPDFFKSLINRDSLEIEVTREEKIARPTSFSRDLESFFSFLSSSLSK